MVALFKGGSSARIKVLTLSPEFWREPPLLIIFCSPFWLMAHELVAKDGGKPVMAEPVRKYSTDFLGKTYP